MSKTSISRPRLSAKASASGFVLYFWGSKFWLSLETYLLKYSICQIRNSLEDLKLLQEMESSRSIFFCPGRTTSTLLALGSRVLGVLMLSHQPRMSLTYSLTHPALTRTGALINKHRLCFQVFKCVNLPMLIAHTKLARNKMFVLAEQAVLL